MSSKILVWCAISIAAITVCLLLAIKYFPTPSCALKSPLACDDPHVEEDGFVFKVGNIGDEPIQIIDITISRRDGPRCYFPRDRLPDLIEPKRALTYVISPDHPDGTCLMEGMEPGNTYKLIIEVEFSQNGVNATINGVGKVLYS